MYICLCHSVTDSDIRKAVADGVRSIEQLAFVTGCTSGCGCCREMAGEVLQESMRQQRRFLSVVKTESAA